jgi:hypothetical protein
MSTTPELRPATWLGPPHGKGHPQYWPKAGSVAIRAERDWRIFELAVTGKSERAIGKELDIAQSTVSDAIHRVIDGRNDEWAERYREVRKEQLALVVEQLIVEIMRPDNRSKGRSAIALMKVFEREARMLGTDADSEQDPNRRDPLMELIYDVFGRPAVAGEVESDAPIELERGNTDEGPGSTVRESWREHKDDGG